MSSNVCIPHVNLSSDLYPAPTDPYVLAHAAAVDEGTVQVPGDLGGNHARDGGGEVTKTRLYGFP